ncbi:MAG: hypothetical protein ACE5FG_10950 [Myxococcota bacterium]
MRLNVRPVTPQARTGPDRLLVSREPGEPLAGRLEALLGRQFGVVFGRPFACALRIVGRAELAREGPEPLAEHRSEAPGIPALVLLPSPSPPALVRECLRSGAREVLGEDEIHGRLADTVQCALTEAQSGVEELTRERGRNDGAR